MAIYSGSPFGTLSGKLGQAVAATWKGIKTARSYQPNVSNPNTTGQQTQRGKFGDAVQFLKPILAFMIRPLVDQSSPGSTGWATCIKNAIAQASGSMVFVWANIKIAVGSRLQPAIATSVVDISNGTTITTWSNTVSTGLNASTDLIRVVTYNVTLDKWGIPSAPVAFSAGTITVSNPSGTVLGNVCHTYLCSTDVNGENPSDSSHLTATVQA